ncbi:SPOR domain-containing protein [Paraburkholderia sp. BL10I2N1]|uniref:SPOR domain-containing protein n=1 Tax=Paraburkholderia sp. BL10I2N1 TaxID=1938796 RepID=UPI0010608AC1|nr:SPOR domain-containing protein [Paraburkholderia sp. BL10I2N1]TDN62948.1 DedD protein [Paraburkholderia sp. BL10I2N1]
MGLFSFGKKDDAPTRRGANSSASRATRGERVERRTRRTERAGDADAMLLDPSLPEKQRARRRLVGAIALVVAAVVVLPMVLDSHPKPVTDDISIDIPSRPAPKVSATSEDSQAGVAPDNPTAATAMVASGLAPAAPKTDTAVKVPAVSATTQTANVAPASAAKLTKPQTPSQTPAAQPTVQTQAKQPAKSTQAADTATQGAAAAEADSGTPAAPAGSRYAVQLGSFSDDVSARNWATKLKAAGVPAYTERRKQADGSMHTLLRAGPFADRAAASAAIAKVREAGLTSGPNNGAAQ